MTLYYIDPSQNYLQTLAYFLFENHKNDLENIEIFLPTRRACGALKEEFAKALGYKGILKILPIVEYEEEDQGEVFDNLKIIPRLEQRRIVTDIINSYKPLDFTLYQSASLSSSLILLFNQIDSQKIDIARFAEISVDDAAEHWIKILNFITYSYNSFKDYLKNTNQIDYPSARNLKLQKNNYLNKPRYPVVIAGSSGSIKIVREFIKTLASYDNCYAILPAVKFEGSIDIDKGEISPLYHIMKLMEYCNIKEAQMLPNKFIANIAQVRHAPLIFEVENKLEETYCISYIIKDILQKSCSARIAIVTYDENLIYSIELYLKKFDLNINNNMGYKLKNSDFATFFILLTKMILSDFLPIDILAFLKHKFLICAHVFEIEKQIFRGSEINEGYQGLYGKMDKIKVPESKIWFEDLLDKIRPLVKMGMSQEIDFGDFTKEILATIKSINSNTHNQINDSAIIFFQEFIEAHISNIYPKEFYLFLIEKYISDIRYYPKPSSSGSIFAVSPIDVRMLHFDYIIIADMNESSWPKNIPTDPWMNIKMREEVGLPLMQTDIAKSFHDFYVLTHARNLVITRSKKIDGIQTSPSRFLKSLIPDAIAFYRKLNQLTIAK